MIFWGHKTLHAVALSKLRILRFLGYFWSFFRERRWHFLRNSRFVSNRGTLRWLLYAFLFYRWHLSLYMFLSLLLLFFLYSLGIFLFKCTVFCANLPIIIKALGFQRIVIVFLGIKRYPLGESFAFFKFFTWLDLSVFDCIVDRSLHEFGLIFSIVIDEFVMTIFVLTLNAVRNC